MPLRAFASEAWPLMTYQPFNLPNGIGISPVTYVGYFWATQAVDMTCAPNRIWHQDEDKAYQENAACVAGFRATADGSKWPKLGDTLRVELRVPPSSGFKEINGWSERDLILVTIECLKANAAQFRTHGVRFMALRIRGSREFFSLGGVSSVVGYECGPKKSQFP